MISDSLAKPISKVATKSFSHMSNSKKPSIQLIFHNHWEEFLTHPDVIKNGMRPIVPIEVEKMLSCGTIDAGFEIYECPNCHKSHIICYTCKSRFCNSCGTKQAKIRAQEITEHTLDVSHRHMVFTIDESLRYYFKKDRPLLKALFDAVKDTLVYVFDNMNGKDKTFRPGFILTLHTFGRDLKWNPHIHCLCTEGGMDDDGKYKSIKYISYESLRKSFMKQLTQHMKDFYQDNPATLKELKKVINDIYKEKKNGFYVNAPKPKSKKGKDSIVSYMIRYTGRPVMASSRIISYDRENKIIKYYYEDHKTEERVEVTEHVLKFMGKLITYIPEAQFKMIRYYGLYATCNHIHKSKVKEKMREALNRKKTENDRHTYRKDLIDIFGTDPLLCDCGHYMEYIDYWVPEARRNHDEELP